MMKQYLVFIVWILTFYPICVHAMEESEDRSVAYVLSTAFVNAVFGDACNDMVDVYLSEEPSDSSYGYASDNDSGSIELSDEFSYESEDVAEFIDTEASDDLNDVWICQNIDELRAKRLLVEKALEFHYIPNQAMKDLFEQYVAVYDEDSCQSIERGLFEQELRIAFTQITNKPKRILRYSYYQQYHNEKEGDTLKQLFSFPKLFRACKKTRIAGCSAIGAALLAPYVSSERKRIFVDQLLDCWGFVPTDNDYKLAMIVAYDVMSPMLKKNILWLLDGPNKNGLCMFMLPKDVRKYVIDYMILLLRKEYGFI